MVDPNERNETVGNGVRGRKVTPEEVAYRDGYVRGRAQDDRVHRRELSRQPPRSSPNRSAATSVIAGVLLFILAAIVGGIFLLALRNDSDVAEPQPQDSETLEQETPEPDASILERAEEAVPSPPDVIQPEININLPTSEQSEPASGAQEGQPDAGTQSEAEATDSQGTQ